MKTNPEQVSTCDILRHRDMPLRRPDTYSISAELGGPLTTQNLAFERLAFAGGEQHNQRRVHP